MVGLRLTIFHSKFIWHIFHDNDSEISLPKLRRLFNTYTYTEPLQFFLFNFFIFKVTNVSFLQKICKLLLFHNIFLLFATVKEELEKERKNI